MKIKSHNLNPHLLSTQRIRKLGLDWQELLNPSLAIHANRELNMSKIKLVGFDMDYTLAVYKKLPMESLQYDLARTYLIEDMSYPKELYQLNFDQSLLIRGLVIDKYLGNVLKLDDQNHVWRAYHCRKPLSPEQIITHYGTKRIKVGDQRYYSLDTFFSIPEACLFIDTIECLDGLRKNGSLDSRFIAEKGESLNFNEVFTNIRHGMDTIHSNGSLKNVIRDNIHHFVVQDGEVEVTLRKLKNDGKILFLLTNSTFEYTDTVLSYVFGNYEQPNKNWVELFDLIIVEAQKPIFFTETRPFLAKNHPTDRSLTRKILAGGNIHEFHRMCEVRGAEVLYIGDHIYGDILRSKKDSLWRTCLIIKELNFEIRMALEHKNDFKSLRQIQSEQAQADKRLMKLRTLLGMLKNRIKHDKDADHQLLALVEDLKAQIKHSTSKLQKLKTRHFKLIREIEDKFHKKWGRLLQENQELSRFGAQVRQYACIYTDHIRNFLHYGANHLFIAHKERMTHEFDLD